MSREPPRLQLVRTICRPEGTLGVVEAFRDLGFDFERFYFITDIPEGASRGAHAHKTLRQCIICLSGSVTVDLCDSEQKFSFQLSSFEQALIVPPGYWRDLRDFSTHCTVGVLASKPYDESDYIRDFETFLHWDRRKQETREVSYLPIKRYTDSRYVGRLASDLSESVRETLKSGQYIGGPEVSAFETEFAALCGAEQAVGVANGLEALQLCLMDAGIGCGDEVILPAHTFVATALAVTQVGAEPVLVDVEQDTGLIDVSQVAAAITPRTRAIIPVHLYGHPVDMDPLTALAKSHNILVIEDAAQSHGAAYKGRPCGSLSEAAAFSFYPTKNLGAAGDGGAVTTTTVSRAERIRTLANYGSRVRYEHEKLGLNSRLDPIQASILRRKLTELGGWNERRRALANRYQRGLGGIEGLVTPVVRPWAEPVWHVYAVQVQEGRREALQDYLREHDIGTNIHYPIPIHRQPCFSNKRWRAEGFPIADQFCSQTLSLPLDPLHSDDEIDRVIDVVRNYFRAGRSERATPNVG
ncbi:dTDP-4-amino-4,6-dideoxygalactose transaminase [Methylobacterium phyllostachyos]|uniref:dTDP-4-amino-4,6-dideoxygalactose transaminase n=1 Tax=Methylobacterium phyllostachyos TaxID=582672 RepID=A0A1H0KBR3_9HYPH|nr:DegT/DnrJ/EryC1/StrS family aminotransferase [Methylobacterium phyllostachyos]SDO53407.1 dTDP-4-amino-4,6-dideoxygalactose transaminase [Methylobacterium phyllostachyos]